jgi:uncharacterized membrane protein YfcA
MTVSAILYGSIVGLSLGLTGGGGSIFAVPLLIYGLGFEFTQATALSLGIVAATALFGAVLHRGQGHVLWRHGIVLGAGGLLGLPAGTRIAASLSERTALIMFSCLMVFIGARMLMPRKDARHQERGGEHLGGDQRAMRLKGGVGLGLAGVATGVLSGLFGVGGGFLLTPALLSVSRVGIHQAMATSLVSIVIIASSGFLSTVTRLSGISPTLPGLFFIGSLVGMLWGISLKKRFSPRMLQIVFGVSVLATALFVVVRSV